MKKTCLDCNQTKENDLFAKDPKHTNGTKNICMECAAERKRKYYQQNKDRVCAASKKYRENNKEKVALAKQAWAHSVKAKEYSREYSTRPEVRERFRRLQWKRKYGLDIQESEQMLKYQNHHCPICNSFLNNPVVDHCHKTNKVRGILCPQCNLGLGAFRDNTTYLQNAIKYLLPSGEVV